MSGNGSAPDLLEAALSYARRGWPVIPLYHILDGRCSCGSPHCGTSSGKHPRLEDWPAFATVEADVIRAWWGRWPLANVGLITGSRSGFIALDTDPRHAGDESLRAVEGEEGQLPVTPISLTGGGGSHHLFKHPGRPVKSRTGKDAIRPGLELKGDGGLIVAPPSLHLSGRRYCWEASSEPDDVPIADPPAWLLRAAPKEEHQEGPAADGEPIPEGERNSRLTSLAGSLRRIGLSPLAIAAALLEVNRSKCRPPLPDEEVRRIAESIGKKPPDPFATGAAMGEGTAGKFKFLTLDDLESLPPPRWVIRNAVPEGLSIIYGKSGLGKTFVGLDMALSIASGEPWLGYPVNQGLACYSLAEGVKSLRYRCAAWGYYCLGDPLRRSKPNFRVLPGVPSLLEGGDITALIEAIRGLGRRLRILIIDTYARAISPGNENDTEDTGNAIRSLTRLGTMADSIILIHHEGKTEQRGPRGNSALFAAADAVLMLKAGKGKNHLILRGEKMKDAEGFEGIHFKLEKIILGQDKEGKELSSCQVQWRAPDGQDEKAENSKMVCAIRKVLREPLNRAGLEWGDLVDAVGAWTTPGGKEIPRVPKSSFSRALTWMQERTTPPEIIKKGGRYIWAEFLNEGEEGGPEPPPEHGPDVA